MFYFSLADVMKCPISTKALFQIVKLGKLFKGDGVSVHKVYRTFKSINLGDTFDQVDKEKQHRSEIKN